MTIFPQRRKRKRKRKDNGDQPSHRQWIRGHDCSVPGCKNRDVVAAHVRQRLNGVECGTGMKPPDWWTLPLCDKHHREQHNIGEIAFEQIYQIDMREIASALARRSPHRHKWEDDR